MQDDHRHTHDLPFMQPRVKQAQKTAVSKAIE